MQEKTAQHYRITLDQAKQDYKDGLLTATGLVYYAIAILRPLGQKLRVNKANDFCERLGIKRTSFYRALSLLKLKNLLDWEATEGVILWIPLSKGVANISEARDCRQAELMAESLTDTCQEEVSSHTKQSQIADSSPRSRTAVPDRGQSVPDRGQSVPDRGQQSQIADSQSQIADSQASKPLSDKDSKTSPDITDIYQIFFISLSNEEREIFKTFSREIVGKLPSTPALPEKWIEVHHAEIWKQYKGTNVEVKAEIDRRAIAPPSLEQMSKLQELKNAGEIKDFYPNNTRGDGTIVVDTGYAVLFWWEFFKMANLEA